jgi:hypothetical protein
VSGPYPAYSVIVDRVIYGGDPVSGVLYSPVESLGLVLAVLDQADAVLCSPKIMSAISLLEEALREEQGAATEPPSDRECSYCGEPAASECVLTGGEPGRICEECTAADQALAITFRLALVAHIREQILTERGLEDTTDARLGLVAHIREQLRAGTYETEGKLRIAAEKLIDILGRSQGTGGE